MPSERTFGDTWVALLAVAASLAFGWLTPDSISWIGSVAAILVLLVLIVRRRKRDKRSP